MGADKTKNYVVDLVGLRQYAAKDSFKCRRVRRSGAPLREPCPPRVLDSSGDWLDLSMRPEYWPAAVKDVNALPRRSDLPAASETFKQIAEWMNTTVRSGHAVA